MNTISQMTAAILRREGGFSADPDDPGGATQHGVTLATLRALGLDLDQDGDVDRADLLALSQSQAAQIFEQHYYYGPKIDRLPEVLRASVYDMYVNAGKNAVRVLQELLNDLGASLETDGAIGPLTLKAARQAVQKYPALMVADAYGIARRNYYYALGDKRPRSRKFARRKDGGKGGWITRAEEFISERFHLTDAQHAQRVAAWG